MSFFQCLCISPTYELALQTGKVITQMGKFYPEVTLAYAVRGHKSKWLKLSLRILCKHENQILMHDGLCAHCQWSVALRSRSRSSSAHLGQFWTGASSWSSSTRKRSKCLFWMRLMSWSPHRDTKTRASAFRGELSLVFGELTFKPGKCIQTDFYFVCLDLIINLLLLKK